MVNVKQLDSDVAQPYLCPAHSSCRFAENQANIESGQFQRTERISRSMKRFGAAELAMLLAIFGPVASAQSPLADAVEKSDRATIGALLKQQADVNTPQADGMTALHWAAYLDDFEIAKALADAKGNVAVTNRYGVTPLSLACQNGNTSMVELLLAPA